MAQVRVVHGRRNTSVRKRVSKDSYNAAMRAYDHAYNQEIRDINRAVEAMERSMTIDLKEKYKKYIPAELV